uniref:Uncharacterized protein n=1 Tax=Crocodylus porosus TaxID=8502 RepID=A0A7M4E9S7_CROPO
TGASLCSTGAPRQATWLLKLGKYRAQLLESSKSYDSSKQATTPRTSSDGKVVTAASYGLHLLCIPSVTEMMYSM